MEMVDNVAVSVIWSLIGAELFPVILGGNQTVTSGISTQLDSILEICSFHQFLFKKILFFSYSFYLEEMF